MTDWPVKTLDALCDEGVVLLGRGDVISKRDIAANPGPYPIYSSARENEGKFGEYGDYMFDEEMITWSIDGGGRLFYRSKHKFSVTNVGGTLRVLKPKILAIRYLHRALEDLHSRKVFDWVFKAHPSVIRKVYDKIPVPPLDEQKRIVELLDAATARVTELTACYEQARTHANNLFTSALRDALESNPDWPVKTLNEVCELQRGHDLPTPERREGNVPILGSTGVTGFHNVARYRGPGVSIGRSGFIGGAQFCESSYWPLNTCLFVRDFFGNDPKWVYYFLKSINFSQYNSGTTQPSLNRNNLNGILVKTPPISDQQATVLRLDAVRAKTSEMVAAYDAKLTAAKNLRQSILESAFAGDL